MEEYILEKKVWDEKDFSEMGWHDARIYAFAIEKNYDEFTADLVFDIDYIFSWVHPVEPEKYFSFWVAPCTLIFKEAFNLTMNIETGLTEFYHGVGKYQANVGVELTYLPRNRVNLKIKFEEGEAASVRQINIVGNKLFSDEDLLADIESKQDLPWWRFMSSNPC